MVLVRGQQGGFDVQFDLRNINLNDLYANADQITFTDRSGETMATVALQDVISFRFDLGGGRSAQLWFNVDGLTRDRNGNVTGGTVTDVLDLTGLSGGRLGVNYTMTGLEISAPALRAAMSSPGLADDRSLFAAAFGGADRILLAGGNDLFNAGGGNDLLRGGAGDDSLHGGAGRDRLLGEAGNDALTGGTGADQFTFAPRGGDDIIRDFTDGQDRIRITGGASSMADLSLSQQGRDTLIEFADTTVLVSRTALANLTTADFIFG